MKARQRKPNEGLFHQILIKRNNNVSAFYLCEKKGEEVIGTPKGCFMIYLRIKPLLFFIAAEGRGHIDISLIGNQIAIWYSIYIP